MTLWQPAAREKGGSEGGKGAPIGRSESAASEVWRGPSQRLISKVAFRLSMGSVGVVRCLHMMIFARPATLCEWQTTRGSGAAAVSSSSEGGTLWTSEVISDHQLPRACVEVISDHQRSSGGHQWPRACVEVISDHQKSSLIISGHAPASRSSAIIRGHH